MKKAEDKKGLLLNFLLILYFFIFLKFFPLILYFFIFFDNHISSFWKIFFFLKFVHMVHAKNLNKITFLHCYLNLKIYNSIELRHISSAVAQRRFVRKVFLKISQNSPVPESLL